MKRNFFSSYTAVALLAGGWVFAPASRAAEPAKTPRAIARFPLGFYHFMGTPLWAAMGVFYTIEDFRGDTAWNRYRAEAERRGTKLWLRDIVPPPIPDAENFVAVPFIQEKFRVTGAKQQPGEEVPRPLKAPEYLGNFLTGQRADVSKMRAALVQAGQIAEPGPDPARDVLEALAKHAPALAQLREAAPRPGYYYPLAWDKGVAMLNYHFGPIHAAGLALQSSIHAHLALGDHAAALRDWRLFFRLVESYDGHSGFIGGLISSIHTQHLLTVLWDGCAGHRWTDGELTAIEEKLRSLNFIARSRRVLAIERGTINEDMNRLFQASPADLTKALVPESMRSTAPAGVFPKGWVTLNMALINRFFDEVAAQIEPVNGQERPSFPAMEDSATWVYRNLGSARWQQIPYFLTMMFIPSASTLIDKLLATEMSVRQARLACALERHYLQHRVYPEKLDALVPAYLPAIPGDVFDGQPMRYRRGEDGGYTLWSIGANRTDDGGKAEPSPTNKQPLDGVWKIPGQ